LTTVFQDLMLIEVPSAELEESVVTNPCQHRTGRLKNSGELGPGYLTGKPEAVQTKPPT